MTVVCSSLLAGSVSALDNLCFNGSFDNPEDPLKGWTYDYRWLNNSHYMANHEKVSAQAREGAAVKVVKMTSTSDAGVKLECKPIVFEPGYRYSCRMKIKGGPCRIYFAGHKWKPGIRPHDHPEMGELRTIYKSKAYADTESGWKTIALELPGVKASPASISHLKKVRFVTLYIWTLEELHVDDVQIIKVKDPRMAR